MSEREKIFKDYWPLVRSKLRLRYPNELRHTDLSMENKNEEDLLDILRRKTGKSRDQLIIEINTLIAEA